MYPYQGFYQICRNQVLFQLRVGPLAAVVNYSQLKVLHSLLEHHLFIFQFRVLEFEDFVSYWYLSVQLAILPYLIENAI